MAILNYTTTVDPVKTVGEIQKILSKHGAINNSVDFDGIVPIALTFMIVSQGEYLSFRLPSNYQGVLNSMNKDPKVPRRYKTITQARRVAWRITKDWVEAQMAIVEAELASITEIFLPYAILPNGETIYDVVKRGGLKALASNTNTTKLMN